VLSPTFCFLIGNILLKPVKFSSSANDESKPEDGVSFLLLTKLSLKNFKILNSDS